jgi:hypothetical protein
MGWPSHKSETNPNDQSSKYQTKGRLAETRNYREKIRKGKREQGKSQKLKVKKGKPRIGTRLRRRATLGRWIKCFFQEKK